MTAREPALRLFYAVFPDAPTRARIAAAADSQRWDSTARAVPETNYHVTLAFLGSVAASRVPILEDIGAAQRSEPCALRFDGYEYWPNSAALVAVAGVMPASFEGLWRSLHRGLAERGCALDAAPVRPHVTLARKVLQPPVLQVMSPFDWPVSEFSLLCSDTSGSRSAYTVVRTWPLLYTSART